MRKNIRTLFLIPWPNEEPDPTFLRTVLGLLEKEDIGLVSDGGGVSCFIDPGGWIVKAVRERGAAITALAGASCLSTMLSLSGMEWRSDSSNLFNVAFFSEIATDERGQARFLKAAAREDEALLLRRRLASPSDEFR